MPSTCWSTRRWPPRAGATRARRRSSTPSCAASCASARRWSRRSPPNRSAAGTIPPGGWSGCEADWPDRWQAIAAADNARPPMTLRVNARRGDGRGLSRRPRRRRACPARRPAALAVRLLQPVPVGSPARVRRGRRLGPGPQRPARRRAAAGGAACRRRARSRRLRRARRQDRAPARAGRPRGAGDRPRRRRGWPGSTPTWPVSAWPPRPSPPTPPGPRPGGTAGRSTRSCSTRRAAPRASCAAIPTSAGCAGPATFPALAATQARLLDALWPLLAPGGRLLYCTCSLFKAEGQDQIDAFLQRHGDAFLPASPASPGHLLPLPDNDRTPSAVPSAAAAADGFFLQLIEKHRDTPTP